MQVRESGDLQRTEVCARRAIKKADSEGVVTMVDVVLNHRTASRLSATTNDWTSFENPDWEEWAIVKVCTQRQLRPLMRETA